jgi:hypothetical protein
MPTMSRFTDFLKAGAKNASGPLVGSFSVAGKRVQCPHCGESSFAMDRALLNTRGRTAFGLDWLDPSAYILVCAECGRIEWYAEEPAGIPN